MPSLGRHLLAEFRGCDPAPLGDLEGVTAAMLEAAARSGATVITHGFHRFGGGGGVSGVVIIAESHLAIHTWPEHAFAAVDFFTCGGKVRTGLALDLLRSAFAAQEVEELVVARGPLQILREGTFPSRAAIVTE